MIKQFFRHTPSAVILLLVIPALFTYSFFPDLASQGEPIAQESDRLLAAFQNDAPVVLNLPEVQTDPGEEFDVKLMINTTAATRAMQFNIAFDPAILRCESISEGTFYRDWAAANGASTLVLPTPSCDNDLGLVTMMGITILGGQSGPSGEGVVADIRFTAMVDGISPLTLGEVIVADDGVVSQELETTLVNGQVTVGQPIILEDTVLRVSPAVNTVAPGETFDVNIDLSTLPGTRGVQFGLQYDPNLLQCQKISVGPFYDNWAKDHGGYAFMVPAPACDNSVGKTTLMGIVLLTYKTDPPGAPYGEGAAATIQFKALAKGISVIHLTDVIVADDQPASQALSTSVLDGSVVIDNSKVFLPMIVLESDM